MTEEHDHTELFAICANKCFVPVSPKTDTDAVEQRVDALESGTVKTTGNQTIGGIKTLTSNLSISNLGSQLNLKSTRDEIGIEGTGHQAIKFQDKNGVDTGELRHYIHSTQTFSRILLSAVNKDSNNANVTSGIELTAYPDGRATTYATRTPSGATGGEIVTANALNSWSSVVHTVGNESISGRKTFESGSYNSTEFKATNLDWVAPATAFNEQWQYFIDKNNVVMGRVGTTVGSTQKSFGLSTRHNNTWHTLGFSVGTDNVVKSVAPTTPANANGNEIATAGWVNDRIEHVVPQGRTTMEINSFDDFKDALDIMKDGAIGNICVSCERYSGSLFLANLTVTGLQQIAGSGVPWYGVSGSTWGDVATNIKFFTLLTDIPSEGLQLTVANDTSIITLDNTMGFKGTYTYI